MKLDLIFDGLTVVTLIIFLFFAIFAAKIFFKSRKKYIKVEDKKIIICWTMFSIILCILSFIRTLVSIELNMPSRIIVLCFVWIPISLFLGSIPFINDKGENTEG